MSSLALLVPASQNSSQRALSIRCFIKDEKTPKYLFKPWVNPLSPTKFSFFDKVKAISHFCFPQTYWNLSKYIGLAQISSDAPHATGWSEKLLPLKTAQHTATSGVPHPHFSTSARRNHFQPEQQKEFALPGHALSIWKLHHCHKV